MCFFLAHIVYTCNAYWIPPNVILLKEIGAFDKTMIAHFSRLF